MALKIKVKPNSSKFSIEKKGEDLVIRTRSPALDNKANLEVVKELSKIVGCKVFISSGLKSKEKQLVAENLSDEQLALRIMQG